jgi:hypothetical protein
MPLGFLIIKNKVNTKIATEATAFESVSLHPQRQPEHVLDQPIEQAYQRYRETTQDCH